MLPPPLYRIKATGENFEKVSTREVKQIEEPEQQEDKGLDAPEAKIKLLEGRVPEKLDSALPKLDMPANLKLDRPFEQAADKDPEKLDKAPLHAELAELKKVLLLSTGSLHFKHGSVYLIKCEGKKRPWKKMGTWQELKKKMPQE